MPYTLVFYEAPHRVAESVADLRAVLGGSRRLVIARELTKLFETLHACTLAEAEAWLAADANRRKGEFVLIVDGADAAGGTGQQRRAARAGDTARRAPAQAGGRAGGEDRAAAGGTSSTSWRSS